MAARLAMRTYDCRSRTPRFLASRVSPLDRGVQKLRIGREGDVLGLHGGIDRDPRQILRPQRPALVRHPQALGEEKFQRVAEALAPMAQVRALVRKLVLEELLSSEVLEIRVIDPALARTFVGQAINMLEQKKPDHKPCRNSGPTTVAIQRCDLAVDKVPVDLTGELHQLVPHVDDLVQLRAEQITRSCRLVLLRPHRSLRYGDRITLLDSRESRKRNCKLPAPQTLKPCNLKSPKPPESDSRSEA